MDKQRLYTVTEVASLLGVTRQTVKNWISDGFIPCVKRNTCLSVRALRCAGRMNVETISDFLAFKKDTWMQLRNFGKKTLKEYEALINEMGLDEYWK